MCPSIALQLPHLLPSTLVRSESGTTGTSVTCTCSVPSFQTNGMQINSLAMSSDLSKRRCIPPSRSKRCDTLMSKRLCEKAHLGHEEGDNDSENLIRNSERSSLSQRAVFSNVRIKFRSECLGQAQQLCERCGIVKCMVQVSFPITQKEVSMRPRLSVLEVTYGRAFLEGWS